MTKILGFNIIPNKTSERQISKHYVNMHILLGYAVEKRAHTSWKSSLKAI